PSVISRQATERMHIIAEMHNQKLNDQINELKNHYPTVQFVTIDIYTIFNDLLANPEKYNQLYHQSLKNFTQSCLTGGIVLKNAATLKKALMQKNQKLDNASADDLSHFVLNSPGLAEAYRASSGPMSVCAN